MSRHGASYRGIASPNAYPQWSVDEDNAGAVQQAMLDLAHRDHVHINLGNSGEDGNGVDGIWREKSQAAWNSFTPDQQHEILRAAELEHESPAPVAQAQAQAQATPTFADLRAHAAADAPALPPGTVSPSPGEMAMLRDADGHLRSLGMPSQAELQSMARAGQAPASSNPANDALNAAILKYARKNQGTPYSLGDVGVGIDCSTFSARALTVAHHATGQPMTSVNGTSEQQICNAAGVDEHTRLNYFRVGQMSDPGLQSRLQPGMTIGIAYDNKKFGFEKGRTNGMAHIGVVMRDEHGQLSVAASDGGKGVEITPLDKWVTYNAKLDSSGARFYVAQPFTQMAAAPQGTEMPQTQVASNTHSSNHSNHAPARHMVPHHLT